MKAQWGTGAVGAHQRRCAEEAVQRKQTELDRTNHLYKALARKSFQLSITLLLHQHPGAPTDPSASLQGHSPSSSTVTTPSAPEPGPPPTVDIHRTIVLPAALPLAKLHKTLQTMMGWEDTQKYMFMTSDGVPIAKYNKDEIPCLSDSKVRLAYIVKESGDELYYQYGEWIHRLIVETVGAPRRNIPSTRVISGAGQCPPDDSTPSSYADGLWLGGERLPFSVDAVNAQLMAGQTFYMRIPASASKEHEEFVCLRAMRTPVNILAAPANIDAPTTTTAPTGTASASTSSSSSYEGTQAPEAASSSSTGRSSMNLHSATPSPSQPPSAVDRYHHQQQHHHHQQAQTRGSGSWDPAAFMGLPPSGSLPGHYYPSTLQHHDLSAWREEAVQQQHQRHLSAPSFFSSSSSSSSTMTPTDDRGFSPSSTSSWISSPFSMPRSSAVVPSLPPSSSFSSSYPPSEADDNADEYYTRERYAPLSSSYQHHNQHQQHLQQQQQQQQHYQHLQSFPHYESSASSSLTPSPSHALLPFPSHTLPPLPSHLSSAPTASPMSMSSRSPSPLFPPPSLSPMIIGGYSPYPPPSSSSSSTSMHDLMLGGSAERLPPLSGTAALFSPESSPLLPPFSSTSSSASSTNSATPPFFHPMSPPDPSSSFSASGQQNYHNHQYQQQHRQHQQQHPHYTMSSSYSSPRDDGSGHHEGSSLDDSFLRRGPSNGQGNVSPTSANANAAAVSLSHPPTYDDDEGGGGPNRH